MVLLSTVAGLPARVAMLTACGIEVTGVNAVLQQILQQYFL